MAIELSDIAPLIENAPAPAAPAAPAPDAAAAPEPTPKANPWSGTANQVKELVGDGELVDDRAGQHWATQPRDDAGRWTTNAEGEVVEAAEGEPATVNEDGTPLAEPEAAAPEGEAAPETPAITINIPDPRNEGKEIAFEVDSQEDADAVRAAIKGSMRASEFKRRLEHVETREAELADVELMLRTAPELIADRMSPEVRQRMLAYLLATDYDTVRPAIGQWQQDDLARREDLLRIREQSAQSRQAFQRQSAEARTARALTAAVDNLIPYSASDEDAQDFRTMALTRLAQLAESGTPLSPETVAAHVARDLQRFGWQPSESGAAERAPQTPSLLATAAPTPTGAAPQGQTAAGSASARQAEVQAQRKAAAAVVPAGAAAAAPVAPPRPKSFTDATKMLRGIPKDQWSGAVR